MAPMGIRLSPLGVAVFCVLGLGVIYHLYSGVISSRIAAFRQGKRGREVKRIREDDTLDAKSKGLTREGVNEMLTLGDLYSHRKMYHLIKNAYPFLQVNSEEHDEAADQETAVWSHKIPDDIRATITESREVPAESITVWIDPLDATKEYTENLRQYVTTMVCVAVDGVPIIGVIYYPFTDYTVWAMVGAGSSVKARASYNEKSPKVIVSLSHAGKVKPFIQEAFGNDTGIIAAGGAGYKVGALLDMPDKYEKADVYIHVTYIKKWDICAGNAILKALGGHMTTLKGEEIDYAGSEANEGGVLASVNMNHKALVEKLPNRENEIHN
ncbi:IMPA3 monophosphatase, partial [Amia calva]|nr:IMPA3 monophosphatase [Amia calva]